LAFDGGGIAVVFSASWTAGGFGAIGFGDGFVDVAMA
jgi:hypothetical protein